MKRCSKDVRESLLRKMYAGIALGVCMGMGTGIIQAATAATAAASASQQAADEQNKSSQFWVSKKQLEEEYAKKPKTDYQSLEVDPNRKEEYIKNPDDKFMIFDQSEVLFEQICRLDIETAKIAKNEMYAREGYIFSDPKYAKIFKKKSWYVPKSKKVNLTPEEKASVQLIDWYIKLREKGAFDVQRYTPHEISFNDGYRLKMGQTINVDIDGDGKEENIQVRMSAQNNPEEPVSKAEIVVDKNILPIEGIYFNDEVWIVDIDPSDKYKEIVVSEHNENDNQTDTYFYYKDGKIIESGEVMGHINSTEPHFESDFNNYIKDGILYSVTRCDILDTQLYRCQYKLDADHKLKEVQTNNIVKVNIPLRIKAQMTTYKDQNISTKAGILKAGTDVTAIATDGKNWVKLQCNNGKQVWVYVKDDSVSSEFFLGCWLVC